MTRITRLIMHGFKSFAKRIELEFDQDFNVILGPNGSGKSNVLDALCFVLGKRSAKSLRAEKASNLIYNGGKTKQPSKQAEVSIVFDNSKKTFPYNLKEVKVSRFVRHTGVSKYQINDKTVTRQQVLDLLAIASINPDGYNIMLQGDITHFVEMSPTERRDIIGEIAGISVYEDKKKKALNELGKVDGKLSEADIILKERSNYLKELKKERDQALKFKELNNKVDQNRASLLKIQIDGKQEKIDGLEKRKKGFKSDFDKVEGDIKKLKDKVKQNKTETSEITKRVEQEGDKDVNKLNKEIEDFRIDIASDKTRVNSHKNELGRIESRKEQLSLNIEEIDNKNESYLKDVKELKVKKERLGKEEKLVVDKITAFKKKHKLDEESEKIEKELESIDKDAEILQQKAEGLRTKQHQLFRENDVLDVKIKTTEEKIIKIKEISKEHKGQLTELESKRKQFKKITLDLNSTLDKDSELAARLGESRKTLLGLNEEISKARARSESIKESARRNIAVEVIMKNKSRFNGVHGPVSDLGEVSSKYSIALEIAAGGRLRSIVVDNDGVAAKCINYLKTSKLGVATFLPLNKMRDTKVDNRFSKGNGIHGYAIELVNFDPKFKKAFSFVFGNTIVVDSIEVARKIGIGKIRMVTLDGDLIETSGAMQGGFRKRKTGLGFKEKELTKGLVDLEKRAEEFRNQISLLESQKGNNEDEIQRLRGIKAELEGEIIKTEKSLHLEDTDFDASSDFKEKMVKEKSSVEEELRKVQTDISICNRELVNVKMRKVKLREEINKLKNPILLAELNSFEQKRNELKEELIKINAQISNSESQVSEMMDREKENINKILRQGEREAENFKLEIKKIQDDLKKKEKELKEKESHVKKLYSKFKVLFDKRSKLNEEIDKAEDKINGLDDRSRAVETKMNMMSLELAKFRAEMAGLNEEFIQFKGVKIVKKPIEELKKEINAFERMRQNIGSVNMKALEIYESVAEKYNELKEKREKLDEEKKEILSMMEEIEGKKSEMFMKTFEEVNEKFRNVFSEISTKGSQVYLELDEPKKPFEGGMSIKAKISSKKYLDIRSLSGGEKTMTALAFIFAIQEYNPASFYVLDEVDAALDKHNSEKLARLIRKYSVNAQYVVISHNDGIISEAQNLYGVSMDEHGISKIVSLRI